MPKIKLNQLIRDRGLDPKEVAKHLFPKNKQPMQGLKRIIRENIPLDELQISRLASYAELPIAKLYDYNWERKTTPKAHHFRLGKYTAELNLKTWITKLYHDGNMFHASILSPSSIPLEEYFTKLDYQIKIFENEQASN